MTIRTSGRDASSMDHAGKALKRLRSSGRRGNLVKVGHNKMGRTKYRALDGSVASEGFASSRSAAPRRPRRVPAPERYPNLAAARRLDHAEHVRRAMAMGLTRKEAERHARSDARDGRLQEKLKRRGARARTGTSR